MKFIRREAEELKLSPNYSLEKYRRAFPTRYSELVNRCCQNGGCFDEVIPRFHVVHRQVIQPAIYGYSKNELFLEPDTVNFLRDYGSVIENLAIGSWVRFTAVHKCAAIVRENSRS